jgi:protein SCO1/2
MVSKGRNFESYLGRKMKLVFPALLTAIIAFAALSGGATPVGAHSLDSVEQQQIQREAKVEFVNRPAPDFSLTDPAGNGVQLADFRGKVVILYFIYTACPDICPLATQKIIEIQNLVSVTPMLERVAFIAITTDPVTDTPDVMRGYMEAQGVDPENFLFLSSGAEQPAATRNLATEFGLKFTPTDDGYQMHDTVINVIDRELRIRARYHGLEFNSTNVVLYLNALSNDLDVHPAPVAGAATASQPDEVNIVRSMWIGFGIIFVAAVSFAVLVVGRIRRRKRRRTSIS